MIRGDSMLVSLVTLGDQLPWPPEPDTRPRGCPRQYADRLMLKALIIMIIWRLYSAYALLRFLEQDDPVVIKLRRLLVEQGRFPSHRTWERRDGGVAVRKVFHQLRSKSIEPCMLESLKVLIRLRVAL